MIVWVDAQLSPDLAQWIQKRFKIDCFSLRDLNLQHAKDEEIFQAARKAKAIFISKDHDFRELVLKKGAPPQVLWITCGNTSTHALQAIFELFFSQAMELLAKGEPLVEITGVVLKPAIKGAR